MDAQYILSGKVVRGNRLGRAIGFPTINLLPEKDKPFPLRFGVYAVKVLWQERLYNGMANVGIRPTLENSHDLVIEANLFDFSRDLYDEMISIYFFDYIREEIKFANIEDLKVAIENDKEIIQKILIQRV